MSERLTDLFLHVDELARLQILCSECQVNFLVGINLITRHECKSPDCTCEGVHS